MTKRYKTLQKKLQELQAELSLIFSLPAETPYHHSVSDSIQQRFVFLKNLLSAEIASHPSKPSHLHHIGKQLAELEIAFSEWDDYRKSVINCNLDSTSVCSCNESSRDDDGEAASDLPNSELGSFEHDQVLQQQSSPPAPVKVDMQERGNKQRNGDLSSCEEFGCQQQNSPRAKVNGEGKEHAWNEVAVEKKEGRISMLGKYFGVLFGGMILGIILMVAAIAMVGDCRCSYSTTHDEGFLFST